jgi:hypothetical protein
VIALLAVLGVDLVVIVVLLVSMLVLHSRERKDDGLETGDER